MAAIAPNVITNDKSATIVIVLRLIRSASTPPGSARNSIGNIIAAVTSDTINGESVSCCISHPRVRTCML